MLWNGILAIFLNLWMFEAGRSTSELRSVYEPQVIILWIKEVEIARSIDELATSLSITGQPKFPDFDMLDAMIASALKKLLHTQSNFRKRVSVKNQRARPILTSVQPEFMKQYMNSQLCSLQVYRMMTSQDFDVRWEHAVSSVK